MSRKFRRKWSIRHLVCALVGMVLFIAAMLSFPSLDVAASYVVYPVMTVQERLVSPIKNWLDNRATVAELQEKIEQLQKEKEFLLTDIIRLQAGKTYADDSVELVDFKKRYSGATQGHLVQVLMRNFSEQSHFFIIDAGSSKGIVPDMAVVYKDNLVGRVTQVYPWYSKVMLITDRTCKVSAYCSITRAAGIFVGMNNNNETELTRVSHLCPVLEDDLILASGDGLIFPRGFALGRVRSVERNGLFYTIKAEPLIDIHALTYCYVIQKGAELIQPCE